MKKGFTLLELLIVIGIASTLLVFGANFFSYSQKKARDAKRVSNLEEIRAALELYRSSDSLSAYPAANAVSMPDGCNNNGAISDSSGTYLSKIPEDPQCGIYSYNYSATTDYTLCARLETTAGTSTTVDCSATGGTSKTCNYCVGPYGQK